MKTTEIIDLFRHSTDFTVVSAGQSIFTEGEPGDVMYVVKEGEVDILVHDIVIETVGPGGILGEMALIDAKARSATAIAKTDCKLVPINEKRFAFLVQQTPYFSLQVMRILVDRLRRMDTRV
jgi:CRP-like cAMP-binding protein